MMHELAFAYGSPKSSGKIKACPEDFFVEEILGFEPAGEGEHLFLQIEKKLLTTEEMIRILSQKLAVDINRISYAGLKDKFARTIQWFSVHLPGMPDPDLNQLNSENYHLLKAVRHHKKLKIGALKENRFSIKIQDFQCDQSDINMRIRQIIKRGVPNYFGPQRFGNQCSNLNHAYSLLFENKKVKNRHLRSIYYSAARAFLFNQVLSYRVLNDCWDQPVNGDLMMLSGTNSIFRLDEVDDEIKRRVSARDIYPTAPLWGQDKKRIQDDALDLESKALEPWQEWCLKLEEHGLKKSYRSMVLYPSQFQFRDNTMSFILPKGGFATTVLRELVCDLSFE
ncbi:tRNA pseudouridine(13) synthase TruD [Legionella londiniensis]|nr:tRNA pseudouridine(13) synthase TruD [Legionella londiniensis]